MGSGTGTSAGAVICPAPEKKTGDNSPGGGGLLVPVPTANPVAPVKMPVPPRIVIELVVVCPVASGALNRNSSVPKKVSAPPVNDAVKVFTTEMGAKIPDGKTVNVITPVSE
jgi:hypothetical protein